MGISTIVGLIASFATLGVAIAMEGGKPEQFISISAALIVFGGTFGATIVSFPLSVVMKLPAFIGKAFAGEGLGIEPRQIVETFVELAQRARREGLLSLEEETAKISDSFVKKGMQLVVDGIDPELVRNILDVDIAAMAERHHRGYGMLEAMGGYAPTMGIIGTVMGLVNVLSSLEDPSELGHAIAVAFIATLYGVASANLIWLPIGSKLKAKSKEEIWLREVAREGILAVQAGDNPRIVREKLEAFLANAQRGEKAKDAKVAEHAGKEAIPVPGAQ